MATYTVAPSGGNINSASTYVGGVGIPGATDAIDFTTSSGQLTVNTTTTIQDIDFSNYQNVITFNSTLSVSRNITFGDAGGLSTYTVASGANGDFRKTGTGNLTSNGKIWTFRFTFAPGSYTITLIDKITISGLITVSGATGNTFTLDSSDALDPERFDVLGDFTSSGTGAVLTGNATIKFTGTANQTISYSSTGQTRSNIKIDKTGGTLFLSGTINYNTGTFTYVQGTVDEGTSTLNSAVGTTFETDGIIWNNFTFAGTTAQTFTLNNNLTVSGTLSFSGTTTTTINGSDIIVTGNLSVTTTATITGSFDILINGTGSQSWTHTAAGYIQKNITINKPSGTLTLGSNVYYRTGTLTFIASGGTVDATSNSSILNIGGSTTLNTSDMSWYRLICGTTATITLTSNLNITNYAQYFNGTITHSGAVYNLTGDLYIGNNISSVNVSFTNTDINIVNLFVNLRLGYTYVVNNGSANINISGNYTLNNMDNSSGTITCTPIRLVGNGTWSCTTTVAGFYASHNGDITIDTAGTITFGTIVFLGGGTISKLSGTIDTTTNSNTFYVRGGTINISDITWNNFFFASGGANTMTLANNLYISNTFTCGGNGTISGTFDIYCGNCNINNSSSGASVTTITYSGIIYCSNNLTFSGNSSVCSITGTVYVGGSVFFNAPASTQGAGNIYMVGNGVISSLNIIYPINTNLYFDTGGKITISTPINFANGVARIINLIRGNVDASKCDLYLNQNLNHTLTNMHKIAWKSVNVAGTATILTMNEFFCGNAYTRTVVRPTIATNNYTVTFTDNFEKIAKFVDISGCTLSRPQQLLVITDSKKSSTSKGIRYVNSLPNGISKGVPSIQNILTPGQSSNLLVGDPAFIKTI
jgi:hypothetical protein